MQNAIERIQYMAQQKQIRFCDMLTIARDEAYRLDMPAQFDELESVRVRMCEVAPCQCN